MSVASCLLLFIAIKRQWCRECILKFEGFAQTKGFLLRSDLQICIVLSQLRLKYVLPANRITCVLLIQMKPAAWFEIPLTAKERPTDW